MSARACSLIDGNATSDAYLFDDSYERKVMVSDRVAPDFRMRIALDIIKTQPLIVAQDGGEDSIGRQKHQVMPAADVAARACDIADALYQQGISRGWLLRLGDCAAPGAI